MSADYNNIYPLIYNFILSLHLGWCRQVGNELPSFWLDMHTLCKIIYLPMIKKRHKLTFFNVLNWICLESCPSHCLKCHPVALEKKHI